MSALASELIPETNKKQGVCYAVSDDGLELPVIDITHAAFAFEMSEAELSALKAQLAELQKQLDRLSS